MHAFGAVFFRGDEAHGFSADPLGNYLLQADKRAAADEQNVGGVYRGELLVQMLAAALGRDIGDGAFQNLEKRLLHAFARDIPRN